MQEASNGKVKRVDVDPYFGLRVFAERSLVGMSQYELARRIAAHTGARPPTQSWVSKLENGRYSSVDVGMLAALESIFGPLLVEAPALETV